MNSLKQKSVKELLELEVDVLEELRERKVLRTANNPTGDVAEYIFCKAFGWHQEPNSNKSFDATDAQGTRYQIKGRRLHGRNKSRQMSAIRDLGGFDFLAGVLFNKDYNVLRAALVPINIVKAHVTPDRHVNSYRFLLRDHIWGEPGVVDVTARLQALEL